jgi:hypothetical protein
LPVPSRDGFFLSGIASHTCLQDETSQPNTRHKKQPGDKEKRQQKKNHAKTLFSFRNLMAMILQNIRNLFGKHFKHFSLNRKKSTKTKNNKNKIQNRNRRKKTKKPKEKRKASPTKSSPHNITSEKK